MAYKWCVVPKCRNTTIHSPQKLFVSVPTNPKRRKLWLKLARRDPGSILSHTNVFMCEDHFNMEKDTINYMKYKMGFSKNILLTDTAVPSKFHCQDDCKTRLTDSGFSREVFLKRQRVNGVTECLQSQRATESSVKDLHKIDNIKQEIIQPEELQRTQDKETMTDHIITVKKPVQARVNIHYRSKAVQTNIQNKSISTSPLQISTTSQFTSPIKVEPCLKPSQSGVVKEFKREILLEDEKSDIDISCLESGQSPPFVVTSSSRVTESNISVTDANENIEQLQCLKNTMHLINKKPLMYVGIIF